MEEQEFEDGKHDNIEGISEELYDLIYF